jgi:hypothetical protein
MKLSVSHPSHSPLEITKCGDFTHSHRTTTTHYDDNLAKASSFLQSEQSRNVRFPPIQVKPGLCWSTGFLSSPICAHVIVNLVSTICGVSLMREIYMEAGY